MHLNTLDYALWIACPVVMAGVLAAMYKRGLHRTYPYFFAYVVLQVVDNPLLFWLSTRSYAVYFYAYYVNVFACIVISLVVFCGIFDNAFGGYEHLRKSAIVMFRWTVALVLAAIIMMNLDNHAGHADSIVTWILSALSVLRLAQCALILLLLLFRNYIGISRGNVIFGIALGFGWYAIVNMLVAEAFQRHYNISPLLRQVNALAYFVATLIWLGCVVRGSTPSNRPNRGMLLRTEGWLSLQPFGISLSSRSQFSHAKAFPTRYLIG
jgi:hypothetical protein